NIRKVVAQRAENNQKIYKKDNFYIILIVFTYPRTLCPGLFFMRLIIKKRHKYMHVQSSRILEEL
ncbi:hypothetical protein, partial [Staphylococcus haemolyticus]|uniref:hypothetical protein n=1 Tax=Staphylococcus haemolyticus TaxID=1283 RepID=UPI001F0A3DF9